jgi:hypothetical protein
MPARHSLLVEVGAAGGDSAERQRETRGKEVRQQEVMVRWGRWKGGGDFAKSDLVTKRRSENSEHISILCRSRTI